MNYIVPKSSDWVVDGLVLVKYPNGLCIKSGTDTGLTCAHHIFVNCLQLIYRQSCFTECELSQAT